MKEEAEAFRVELENKPVGDSITGHALTAWPRCGDGEESAISFSFFASFCENL